jgi:hypothetical protein
MTSLIWNINVSASKSDVTYLDAYLQPPTFASFCRRIVPNPRNGISGVRASARFPARIIARLLGPVAGRGSCQLAFMAIVKRRARI